MLFNFEYDISTKRPKMKLCYMNKKVVGYMNDLFELKISPTFLDISQMSFTIKYDNKHYEIIKKHFLVHVAGMGYFVVKQVAHTNNGIEEEIQVECESYESTLNDISVSFLDGKYMLYNVLEPENSLLGMVLNACGWTLGFVDSSIATKERSFDGIDNISIYNFLMTDMSNAYKCYFVFDTENKTISAYDKEKVADKTNIAFTFNNLLKDVGIKENADDIISVMHVSGADGVYISNINPIGNSCLYDFTYFMDNDYGMSNELISALSTWNTKVENAKAEYEVLILTRQQTSETLLTKQSELSVLEAEYKGIQDARGALTYVEADIDGRLTTLKNSETLVLTNIEAKKAEIALLQETYDGTVDSIGIITESLSLDNTDNFAVEERDELRSFEKYGTYTNENFIYTSITTEPEKINISKDLLAEADITFQKLSRPCYEFSMDIINYLYLPEFKKFTDDTQLGVLMNVEIKPHTWVQPRLLKIELDYDDISSTKFVFSDTLRLQDDVHVFEDTFNATTKSSNKVAVTASSWNEPSRTGFYTTVKNYMNESLSLAQQEIMNSANQQLMIGSYGMICRRYDENTGTYDPHELRLNNNLICFSSDGFETVSTALGYLKFGENTYYGLNAQLLVGDMIIGNNLLIANQDENEDCTFSVDGNGAMLKNADFTLENAVNRIFLSPTSGIKIQKKDPLSSIWQDKFYTDTNGNIRAYGITLQESNIAGWTTTSVAFTSPTGDFIGSNGYGQLSLMSWTPTSATFNGNIYANNLMSNNDVGGQNIFVDGTMGGGWLTNSSVDYGKLSDLCVNSLRANLVTTNYLTANYITAGDIQSNFATINELQTNYATINSVQSNYATIGSLDAAVGRIGTLETDSITAGILEAQYLITNEGVFKGKTYIGNEQNNTVIESILTVVSANITAYQLHINSTGGVNLYGGKGGIYLDAGDDERENENPVVLNKLTVSGNSQFNGNIIGDAVFSEDIYLNGSVKVVEGGYEFNGVTQNVTMDGKTLTIKKGIIVGVS